MILSDTKILSTSGLIDPFDSSRLEGASYDLGIGRELCKQGKIEQIDDTVLSISIEPGEFVLLTSEERLQLPNNIVGHNGLSSEWTKRGLVSLFSPQIDPGFIGILIVPVFNTGQETITVRIGEPMITVEFSDCHPASYLWSDKNQPQEHISSPVGPTNIGPYFVELSELSNQVELIQANINSVQTTQLEMQLKLQMWDKFESIYTNRKGWILAVASFVLSFAFIAYRVLFPSP